LKRNREHRHLLAPRLSPEALRAWTWRPARSTRSQPPALRIRAQEELISASTTAWSGPSTTNGEHLPDGYEQTRFADQIQQYACAYTGRISNLYMVDPESTLYAPVPTLPHERI